MTNKSKKLAELLEIKPKYCAKEDGIYSFPFEDSYSYLDSKDENLLEGNEYFLDEEFYPDFEKPENFVKLLKLLHSWNLQILENSVNIGSYINGNSCETLEKALIDSVLRFNDSPSRTYRGINVFDELKQQAQQINWSY